MQGAAHAVLRLLDECMCQHGWLHAFYRELVSRMAPTAASVAHAHAVVVALFLAAAAVLH